MAATPETVISHRTSTSPPSLAMANHNKQNTSSRLPSFSKTRKSSAQGNAITATKSTPSATPSRPPRSGGPFLPDIPNTPFKVIETTPESTRQRAISHQPQSQGTPSPPTNTRKITPDTTPSKGSPFLKRRTSSSQLQVNLPWTSPTGVLDSRTAALMEKSPASLIRHLSKQTSSSGLASLNSATIPLTEWDGGDEDLEFITEFDEQSQIDEELEGLLNDVKVYHTRQVTHYKRLLEQSQSSASLQLHSLQAEVKLLRTHLDAEKDNTRQLRLAQSSMDTRRLECSVSSLNENWNLAELLSIDFDGNKVKKAIKALKRKERSRLISIILDAMLPTDISEQIRLLEKYVKSAFDVVGLLPKELGTRILRELSVHEVLKVSTVSKTWYSLVHYPSLWKYHILCITSADPQPPTPPTIPEGWEPLYKKIHHRESNFRNGLPQEITFLRGHTNFCTTVILKGKRLISGSYDETIRFWDIQTGVQTKCLDVKKPVSCIDFLAEEEVFVCGFHDVGRVHLFSSVTYTPLQQLQGHLYGIRAVAISSKHLVSAGADKALVCWDWRLGNKIVRFGQQTNLNIGVQIIGSSTTGSTGAERVVSVTIDGIVRVFSIQRREMISQFKLCDLGMGDPVLSQRVANVGVGSINMLQWFAANGNQMTCATKNIILHLQWSEEDELTASPDSDRSIVLPTSPPPSKPSGTKSPLPPSSSGRSSVSGRKRAISRSSTTPTMQRQMSVPTVVTSCRPGMSKSRSSFGVAPLTPSSPHSPDVMAGLSKSQMGRAGVAAILAAPPRIVAVIETPDVAVGVMDPRKRRVVTATRFSSRVGAERKIYISTHDANEPHGTPREPTSVPVTEDNELPACTSKQASVYYDTAAVDVRGAWSALATPDDIGSVQVSLPKGFPGLASPAMNPMSMALSHEEIVVGCADGTIYVMNMLGYNHKKGSQEGVSEGSSSSEEEPEVEAFWEY